VKRLTDMSRVSSSSTRAVWPPETSWSVTVICVVLLLATTAAPAFAQQRLFVRMRSEVVELDPRPGSLGTVLRRFPLPAEAGADSYWRNGDAVHFGGGELLAWVSTGDRVVVLNTRNGAVHQVTFPDFSPTAVLGTDGIARLLVLGYNHATLREMVLVTDARSGNTRFLDVGRIADDHVFAYAAASDLLFVANPVFVVGGFNGDVDVIHASTGRLLKTLHNSQVFPHALSTNAAGTRLFVTGGLGTFVFDVASGAFIASNTSDPASTSVAVDEQRNRLIANIPHGAPAEAGIYAFAADRLQFIGRVQVPELPLPPPTRTTAPGLTQEIDFSGLSATLFVLQAVEVRHKYYGSECHESQLIALDAQNGGLHQTVSTTVALGPGACDADLVRVTEPLPPTAGAAEVAGHQLSLTWKAPLGATEYEVEAGSAPGLANLARLTSAEPQLVVDDVPSGVYYVRVRGINTIGKSSASREVQVVVP
jgi:hypothetical protein